MNKAHDKPTGKQPRNGLSRVQAEKSENLGSLSQIELEEFHKWVRNVAAGKRCCFAAHVPFRANTGKP
jgi:hypothetical protein